MNPYREDEVLMQRVASGDARAFRELSDAHLKSIMIYATRLLKNQAEAEDVAQETFLRAWEKAASYQPKARVSTWLHTIARNLALDRLRKGGRSGEHLELDSERDAAPTSDRPSRLLERKATALTVEQALEALPERQRSALLLSHEQGLSNPDIAKILDCSVDAVESLLKRARNQLRALLSQSSLIPQPSTDPQPTETKP